MKKIINKILDKIALAITKCAGVIFLLGIVMLILSAIYLWTFIIVRAFGGQRIYCHFAGSGVLFIIFVCSWAHVRVITRKEHNEKR